MSELQSSSCRDTWKVLAGGLQRRFEMTDIEFAQCIGLTGNETSFTQEQKTNIDLLFQLSATALSEAGESIKPRKYFENMGLLQSILAGGQSNLNATKLAHFDKKGTCGAIWR